MLTTLDIVVYSVVLPVVLPLAIYSLATGSRPPEHSFFSKYYSFEKHLMLVGNLFLLAVCATAAARLTLHFGYFGIDMATAIDQWIALPFMVLLVGFLTMFVRAAKKVHGVEAMA